ncbi:hypothetical protein MRX96_026334 [Rhipicephalus microplus]
MVAPSCLRPKTFFGRVPKGVNNLDICKDLVKRFQVKDIAYVQNVCGGKFEVTFVSEDAVEWFKTKPEIFVGKEVAIPWRAYDDCASFLLPGKLQ